MGDLLDWYALYVETGKEYVVEKQIMNCFRNENVRSFIPSKIVTERKEGVERSVKKILYPGYVFIFLMMTPSVYHKLKRIPKLLCLVRTDKNKNTNNNGYYSKLSNDEMEFILRLSGKKGIIDYSDIKVLDDQVEVLSGPLQGLESLIINVDKRKKRVKLKFPFLGELKTISLGVRINFS